LKTSHKLYHFVEHLAPGTWFAISDFCFHRFVELDGAYECAAKM